MTDRIMIIGAGFGQLPALRAARSMGMETVAIDRNPDAPGLALADFPEAVDIVDIEAAVGVARDYSVQGALTLQSDIGVPTVGAIVDALHLPGNGREVAERCSHKVRLRRSLEQAGVPQPAFIVVTTAEEAAEASKSIGFPSVLKAGDSSGSRGVVRVDGPEDIRAAWIEAKRWARSPELLVEAFVEGIEVGAQTFSVDGLCHTVAVHNDTMSPPPHMIPIGHAFPSSLDSDTLSRVEHAVARCVEALDIRCGPANIDLMIGRDGTPYILEVGARIGATCLPELVSFATGVDWIELAIAAAVGRPVKVPGKAIRPCAALIIESPEDGILERIEGVERWLDHPDILEIETTAHPGDRVQRLRKGTDRVGKVVVRGESAQSAETFAAQVRESIGFTIRSEGKNK